jgi:hypothetical protein
MDNRSSTLLAGPFYRENGMTRLPVSTKETATISLIRTPAPSRIITQPVQKKSQDSAKKGILAL